MAAPCRLHLNAMVGESPAEAQGRHSQAPGHTGPFCHSWRRSWAHLSETPPNVGMVRSGKERRGALGLSGAARACPVLRPASPPPSPRREAFSSAVSLCWGHFPCAPPNPRSTQPPRRLPGTDPPGLGRWREVLGGGRAPGGWPSLRAWDPLAPLTLGPPATLSLVAFPQSCPHLCPFIKHSSHDPN